MGIVGASVAVEITPEVEDAQMQKSVIVQLPINDDKEEKDTELVIARCNTSGVVQVGLLYFDWLQLHNTFFLHFSTKPINNHIKLHIPVF